MSSRSGEPSSTTLEKDVTESSTPQSSMVSSVVIVDKDKIFKTSAGGPGEANKARYVERVRNLDMRNLACRRELIEVLERKSMSQLDLSNHYCMDRLKVNEAHFSRAKTLEAADLTGIPKRSIFGTVNYRPLKELRSPGLIVEPPEHRTSISRNLIPAQLRAVEKLLEPKSMGLPDSLKWAQNCRRIHNTEDLLEPHS